MVYGDISLVCLNCRGRHTWWAADQVAQDVRSGGESPRRAPTHCGECSAAIKADREWWAKSNKVNAEREARRSERQKPTR